MSVARTIVLKGDGLQKEAPVASAKTVTPGHLVERTSTGTIQPHSTAGGLVKGKCFAVENTMRGKGIDDAYAAADNALFRVFAPGSEVNAILAASQIIAIGDLLVSNGDGTLKKLSESAVTDLTENAGAIGGTNDGNLPDISAVTSTYVQAEVVAIRDAVREVAAKVNAVTPVAGITGGAVAVAIEAVTTTGTVARIAVEVL